MYAYEYSECKLIKAAIKLQQIKHSYNSYFNANNNELFFFSKYYFVGSAKKTKKKQQIYT